jgi:hypothetical protein
LVEKQRVTPFFASETALGRVRVGPLAMKKFLKFRSNSEGSTKKPPKQSFEGQVDV